MRHVNIIVATGGTLWQSFAWIEHCFRETFAHLAKKYPQDSSIREPSADELKDMAQSGRALDDNLTFILGTGRPDLQAEAFQFYRKTHDTPEGLAAVKLYPGVWTMLCELKDVGAQLFVASEKATRAIEASFKHLGIGHFFSFVQGAEMGGSTKGSVLERLEVAVQNRMQQDLGPDNAILLEGRPRGVAQALRERGYMSIGTLWGGALPAQMQAAGAAWLAATPQKASQAVAAACLRSPAMGSFRASRYVPVPARDPR